MIKLQYWDIYFVQDNSDNFLDKIIVIIFYTRLCA